MPELDAADLRAIRARAVLEALKVAGEDLLGESQRRAPVELGELRGSASLTYIVNGDRYEAGAVGYPPTMAGAASAYQRAEARAVELARAGTLRTIDVEVAFNRVYAARQHEETTWHHPLGGEAKYLERPLAERAGRYNTIIERNVIRRTEEAA